MKAVVRWWRLELPTHDTNNQANTTLHGQQAPPDSAVLPAALPDAMVPSIFESTRLALLMAAQDAATAAQQGPRPDTPRPQVDRPKLQRALKVYSVPDCDADGGAQIKFMRMRSLTALPKWVGGETTVIFDLDDTLVRRQGQGPQRRLALAEPEAASVVADLQGRGDVCVFGLTARPYQVGDRLVAAKTRRDLVLLGIDFVRGTTSEVHPRVRDPRRAVGFRAGCGYTGGYITKGEMLARLIDQVPMSKLVFIDDLTDNLDAVARFAASARIPCLAVHYTGALDGPEDLERGLAWSSLCAAWCQVGASVVLAKQG